MRGLGGARQWSSTHFLRVLQPPACARAQPMPTLSWPDRRLQAQMVDVDGADRRGARPSPIVL